MCVKFKVNRFSRFCTGALQMLTKSFPCEIPVTVKAAKSNTLQTNFVIQLPSAEFLLKPILSQFINVSEKNYILKTLLGGCLTRPDSYEYFFILKVRIITHIFHFFVDCVTKITKYSSWTVRFRWPVNLGLTYRAGFVST